MAWLFPCMPGLWRKFDNSFPALVFLLMMLLSFSLFPFLIIIILLDISSSAPLSFFYSKDQSTVAKWQSELRRSGTSVPWRVACEVLSLMGSNTVPGQNNIIVVNSNATLLGRGIRMNACVAGTCHLHFWQNDPRGLLHARAVTRVGMDTENKFSPEIWY